MCPTLKTAPFDLLRVCHTEQISTDMTMQIRAMQVHRQKEKA